jgi:lantibiotic modifying enzyme
VVFADGRALAYKPRPIDMEAAFSTILDWVNGQGLRYDHRSPQVLDRDGYGWMEWIDGGPVADAAAADAFYWRAGSLFALYRALNGSDLHSENLIAAGACPVLIDTECLLHPPPDALADRPDLPAITMPSVLTAGLLPLYTFAESGRRAVNLGALGPSCGPDGLEETTYLNAGTDWVLRTRKASPRSTAHLPRLEDRLLDPTGHVSALAAGYRETWSLLLHRRDWLLTAAGSPFAALRRARGRHMTRSTWNYGQLLEAARGPEGMADGITFSILFEALRRPLASLPAGYRKIAEAESRDLERLDVPRFAFAGDDRHTGDCQGRPLARLFAETPFEAMAGRFRAYDQAQVDYEATLIAAALHRPPAVARPTTEAPPTPRQA